MTSLEDFKTLRLLIDGIIQDLERTIIRARSIDAPDAVRADMILTQAALDRVYIRLTYHIKSLEARHESGT